MNRDGRDRVLHEVRRQIESADRYRQHAALEIGPGSPADQERYDKEILKREIEALCGIAVLDHENELDEDPSPAMASLHDDVTRGEHA